MASSFSPEVSNVIWLSLAFGQAAAKCQADTSDNLVLSPYNALTAMAMVAKAAGGQTRAELAQALFGVTPEQLDQAVDALSAVNARMLAANEGKVTLKTANAVWVNGDEAEINPAYAAALKQAFAADISSPKFSSPTTVDAMNKWASDNTNGLIAKIIEQLSPQDIAVLASALYFKGDWTRKFDAALTTDETFTNDQSQAALTKMMQQRFQEGAGLRYQQGEGYEAVALTYGENDRSSGLTPSMRLVLVRPSDARVSARDFMASAAGTTPDWLEAATFEKACGNVRLPHIDIAQKHDLVPVLRAVGVHSAFSASAADFRQMTIDGAAVSIGKVTHDVVFKTDETGSEAAAVTTIGMVRGCVSLTKWIDIAFDRSFVVVLQDVETGLPLFMGAINKPNDKMQAVAKLSR